MLWIAARKSGRRPDIGKGVTAFPCLGPFAPGVFQKINIVRLMDRADRADAVDNACCGTGRVGRGMKDREFGWGAVSDNLAILTIDGKRPTAAAMADL